MSNVVTHDTSSVPPRAGKTGENLCLGLTLEDSKGVINPLHILVCIPNENRLVHKYWKILSSKELLLSRRHFVTCWQMFIDSHIIKNAHKYDHVLSLLTNFRKTFCVYHQIQLLNIF